MSAIGDGSRWHGSELSDDDGDDADAADFYRDLPTEQLIKVLTKERKQHRMVVAKLREQLEDAQADVEVAEGTAWRRKFEARHAEDEATFHECEQLQCQLDGQMARADCLEQELSRERELLQVKLDECLKSHAEEMDEVRQQCMMLQAQLDEATRSRSVEIRDLRRECALLRENLNEAFCEQSIQVEEFARERASQDDIIESLLTRHSQLQAITDEVAKDSEAEVAELRWECSLLWDQLEIRRAEFQEQLVRSEACSEETREGSDAYENCRFVDVDESMNGHVDSPEQANDIILCDSSSVDELNRNRASLQARPDDSSQTQFASSDETGFANLPQLEIRDSEAVNCHASDALAFRRENEHLESNLEELWETYSAQLAALKELDAAAQTHFVEMEAVCKENEQFRQLRLVDENASKEVANLKEECTHLRKQLKSQSEARKERFAYMLELRKEREELRRDMPTSWSSMFGLDWTSIITWQ